ncbi:MAG: hypothetical protein WEA61_00750 [Anaerolineales bacterium]
MDEFDFKEEKPRKPSRFGAALLNCVSLLFVFATLAVGAYFALLFLNPQSELNPFPPPVATVTQAASSTPTLETASATPTPTFTTTPEPTLTPTPQELGQSFGIQEGSPAALDASVFHPELSCNFMGVAGQVFSLDGLPIADLEVAVSGTLNDEAVNKVGVTGAATQYGAGAYYEIQLSNQPIASAGTLQITVKQADGQPMSDPFTFSTTASCQENLVMINFAEQQP